MLPRTLKRPLLILATAVGLLVTAAPAGAIVTDNNDPDKMPLVKRTASSRTHANEVSLTAPLGSTKGSLVDAGARP